MNAITFLSSRFDRLDAVADTIERLLHEAGLPGRVRGAFVGSDYVQMEIHWQCDPFQFDKCQIHFVKCQRLNAKIKSVFGCYGGVDANTKSVFLMANEPIYTGQIEVDR